jgi:2-polyprenyl-3-methyl-5-hydroxy-6-metoxy-1,4-benzoquinol methylase
MLGWAYNWLRRISSRRFHQWIKRQSWFYPISKLIFGNAVYSKSYYEDVEQMESDSMRLIADWICRQLAPRRIVDVGCGPGHLMEALAIRSCQVYGVDISIEAIRKVRSRRLRADLFDLTLKESRISGGPYDLVISCEVAEHLEKHFARRLVEKLTETGNCIFLTAAEPNPARGIGLYHVNEQPNSYWIELMAERGFLLDKESTASARIALADGRVIEYLGRPMVFTRPRK